MKRIISTVLAAALVLSLAACSNSDSSTSTSAAEDSSTAATAETTADTGDDAATEESDLAYIKEKGTMIIGYTVYAPMNYTDDDGNFTGFDTELATAVCEQLGVEPVFQEINWETKVVELDAGTTYDIPLVCSVGGDDEEEDGPQVQ